MWSKPLVKRQATQSNRWPIVAYLLEVRQISPLSLLAVLL